MWHWGGGIHPSVALDKPDRTLARYGCGQRGLRDAGDGLSAGRGGEIAVKAGRGGGIAVKAGPQGIFPENREAVAPGSRSAEAVGPKDVPARSGSAPLRSPEASTPVDGVLRLGCLTQWVIVPKVTSGVQMVCQMIPSAGSVADTM
jgi:hypothetical protein